MVFHELIVQHHIVVGRATHQLNEQIVGRRAGFLRFALGQISMLWIRHVEEETEHLNKILI